VEVDPVIVADALLFVDDTAHCIEAGEIEVGVKRGTFGPDHIAGESCIADALPVAFAAGIIGLVEPAGAQWLRAGTRRDQVHEELAMSTTTR